MSILKPLTALSDHQPTVKAISSYVAKHAGHVCAVCGLKAMGHGPESTWLGHAKHEFTPRDATHADLRRADELTGEAYAARYAAA